jgi:uncharacterized membrane protein YqhA
VSTPAPPPPSAPVSWLFVLARWVLLVGVLSLLAGSVTLLGFGAFETFRHIVRIAGPTGLDISNREMFLASIKLLDLVLLATVLQVVAIGIYSIFIGRSLPVPDWLQASSIDGLKNLLASIVVVMLGVLFLEQVIMAGSSPDLLSVGVGIAAIILALSYFIRANPGD